MKLHDRNTSDDLPNAVLQHYRNLQHHRNTILEGVRTIAFRNMNHLFCTMSRVGVNTFENDREIDVSYDMIFEDQEIDADANCRSTVEYISMIPWGIYLSCWPQLR